MENTSDASLQDELKNLVLKLKAQGEEILHRWEVRVDIDPETGTKTHLSRQQFRDHIPEIWEFYCQALASYSTGTLSDDKTCHEMAHLHSRIRWQQGYNLRSIISEWGHLNFVVFETLESLDQESVSKVSRQALSRARILWVEVVNVNTVEGISEYGDLLQMEARSRLHELEEAFSQVQDIEKARGELLRQASHDLKGSLTAVAGATSLLESSLLGEEGRGHVSKILQSGVKSLAEMLGELMDLARLESGQETRYVAPLDAGELLNLLAAALTPLAQEKGLWLRHEGPASLLVQSDAIQVQRIAQNLLLNAIKYTSTGGVTLAWRQDEPKERWFFEIRDTGPGVQSAREQPLANRLEQATHQSTETLDDERFLPAASPASSSRNFFKTQGEGIGLTIVRRLCEMLEATLEMETELGQGTVFRVILPLHY